MDNYNAGNVAQLTATFTDLNNNLVDPTTVICIVQTPDNVKTTYTSSTTPAIVRASLGVYNLALSLVEVGTYIYRFSGTGSVIAAGFNTFSVTDVTWR